MIGTIFRGRGLRDRGDRRRLLGPDRVFHDCLLGNALRCLEIHFLNDLLHPLPGYVKGHTNDQDDCRPEENLTLGGEGDMTLVEPFGHRAGILPADAPRRPRPWFHDILTVARICKGMI